MSYWYESDREREAGTPENWLELNGPIGDFRHGFWLCLETSGPLGDFRRLSGNLRRLLGALPGLSGDFGDFR